MSAVTALQIHENSFKGALPQSGLQVMRAVFIFHIASNSFKGTLPESGVRTMSAVAYCVFHTNSFEGALPGSGLQVMRTMNKLIIHTNGLKGTLPEEGIGTMSAGTTFDIAENSFEGALPGSGLQVMQAVRHFYIYTNGFKGRIPQSGIRTMSAVTSFDIYINSFEGAFPGSSTRTMSAVKTFSIFMNSFEGALVGSSIRTMTVIKHFDISTNSFEGALPESGLQVMRAVDTFFTFRNSFKGMLPESGIRMISAVRNVEICTNSFEGALPRSGLQVMRAVMHFLIFKNGFKGTLPEEGLRTMTAMVSFCIQSNGFTGVLPENGLQAMRTMRFFFAESNRFAGTLPNRAVAGLVLLAVHKNDFEGAMPSSLNPQMVFLGHTLLGGKIPQRLLGGSAQAQKCVVAEALLHEGTIPESASRLTMADITISFGHGLRGLLPSISGTVGLLSLWENALEGHLPALRMNPTSTLLVYGNDFSCKLPQHYGVKPTSTASLSLIGNHFTQPRCVPTWITPAEQPTEMFCRSNRQIAGFIMLLFCGCCCLVLATFLLKRKTVPMRGEFARVRFAWYETCHQQKRLLLASCVLLPFYSNALLPACTVLADHLQFHVAGRRAALELHLVALFHLCFYLSAAHFQHRYVTQNPMRMAHPPKKAGLRSGHDGSARVYKLWIVVCVITSMPGIWYSMVKAVPGFLQVSDLWRWVLNSSVALFSGLLTGFGLDQLAGKLSGPKIDRATLQLVGVSFASILFPGLVTILCHAECLGGWASFWAPCRGRWPFATKFGAVFKSPLIPANEEVPCDLVSRSDVCGWRWHVNGRECMEATLEHLVWLLYPKFAHYTFTIAAFRIVRGRLRGNGMTLQAACVLLQFSWLVLTLFGPCLPILHALIALLVNIYSILLFGTDFRVLAVKETEEHGASLPSFGFILDVKENQIEVQEHESSLTSFGFGTVALLALAIQSSNLL